MIQYALPIAACLVFAAIAPTAIPQLVGLANSNIVEVGSDGDTSLIDDTTDVDSDTTNNSVTEEGPSSGEPTEADPDETTWLPPFSLGPQAGAPEGSSVDEGDDPTDQSPNAQQDPSDAQSPSDATQNEDPDVVENAPGDSSSSSEPPTATIEPRPTQSVAIDDVALATDAQGAPSTPWIIAICISAAAILAAAIIAIFGIRSWRRSNGD